MIAEWPCPLPQGGTGTEYALTFDRGRQHRLLVLAPLFDEANKLRHQLVEVMRRLDGSGIDSFLPDMPGWNESLEPFQIQTLEGWRHAARAAATHFGITHLLSVRSAAIFAPTDVPGWRYAPIGGPNILRALLRARLVSSREAGRDENMDSLRELGRTDGIELGGYQIGATLFNALDNAPLQDSGILAEIEQATIGGSGLWLRAEPDYDTAQADALAAIVAMGFMA